ncbi:MAG: hypothetical protein IJP14_05590, partial [Clostridia bacterium]|nr:hypothetical protein [Clostridia bacterium]
MKKRKVLSAFLAVAILVSTVCSVSIWLSAANGAGTPPDPAEDYELKESVVMENFLNAPVSNAVATFEGVTVTDIPNVDSAYSYKATMLQDSSTTANQDLRYISSKQKTGLPADKTGLVYKMWVRYTPAAGVSDSVKQTVRFQAPEAIDNNGTAAKGDNLYDDMTVTGNGTWTLVEFPVAEMTGAANFDGCGVWTVTFTSLKGNTFKTGDVIEFANITVVKQQWILKNNGMGAYPGEDYEEGSKVVLSNFLNPPVSNAFATMESVTVTDIPENESASSYKATILQASSTTTNNDFRYISSTKKYGLTDNHEYLMLTFWARYTPKAGASDEASQTIRAQVREAVSDGSGGYVAGDLIYGDAQIVGNGEWQKVKLPISDMVGGVNFDGTGVWTMTFTSLKGNTFVADDVIEFAAVQFERPKWVRKNDGLGAYPGEDYEAGSKTVLENFLNPPVENAFASAARNDVTDVPNTVLASSYQYPILQPSSTTANNDFRYISSTKKDGLPKETDYLILSFWTRYIPKAGANDTAKQTLRVQYREAVANGTSFAAGDLMTGDFTVVGDGTWQKVSMRITDMVGGENFNGCGVWTMTFTSLKGNTFVANDTVEFADIRIEKPVWVLKNNGLGAYPGENYEAGTETVLTDFLNLPAGNAFADMQRVDATDIPNVMLAASYKATLLQNSSATGNNDFRYISTTKKYGLPKETSNLYFTLWVRCVPKTAADPAQKQTIRVTIREAIATGTDTYDGGDTMYGDFVVTCDGSWQQISLPIADMVGGANFDGCGIWTVTFTSLKGNTFKIDDVIEFADIHIEKPVWVLKNGGMGECPGNDYEAGSVSVLQDFLNVPAGNDFASIDRVMAADLPGGTMAYNYRMTLLENYNDTVYNTGNQLWNNTTHNKDFRYISSSKKTGLPADKTGLYVSLWVRYTPKAGTSDSLNQRIRVQIREAIDDGAGAQTSGDLIYGDLVATGNGEWVKVELPIEDMVGAANFDGCGVWTWTFTSLKGNTFSKGDVIEFANVEFRKPAWVLKNDGMGAAPGEDYIIGQKIYWKNEATLISRIVKESLSMKHEIVSIDEAAIDTTKAYKTTFGDAADFNEHKLYYMFYPDAANVNEGIDMSAVMDEARIGFWFKTPEGRDNMSFRLSLFDNKWVGYLNKDFVIVKGG